MKILPLLIRFNNNIIVYLDGVTSPLQGMELPDSSSCLWFLMVSQGSWMVLINQGFHQGLERG